MEMYNMAPPGDLLNFGWNGENEDFLSPIYGTKLLLIYSIYLGVYVLIVSNLYKLVTSSSLLNKIKLLLFPDCGGPYSPKFAHYAPLFVMKPLHKGEKLFVLAFLWQCWPFQSTYDVRWAVYVAAIIVND